MDSSVEVFKNNKLTTYNKPAMNEYPVCPNCFSKNVELKGDKYLCKDCFYEWQDNE